MGDFKSIGKGSSFSDIAITQAIAVVGFVIVPIVITLVAPLSTIEFEKSGAATNVVVERYVLMFVPWRTARVENVKRLRVDVTDEVHYADTVENRRRGRRGTSYATGQVAIIGDGPEVVVQAAPPLAKEVSAKFDQFAKSGAAGPMTVSVYASWGLSYVLGGVATFFCGFYVFGATVALAQFLWKKARRAS
ncbi:hypothetical protein [Methylocystis parvus]|uniref:Uncharacterized protein n=1 Tax=Methylocystis parvus TaxID=134 RepID=A0A6B8M2V9_9HYPH|nr:hypothetical protein [Methylocystis parvus]QGM98164.1 hypothetical protein F7D14_12215 [Methylocystis parvus]WBK01512.1 hypothetical protein MMG94_07360 [Methylocystis parvus OBBP]